mmetsp:Transcript_13849/g.23031  ORF Transcript_13849/g.23031 Transcript_13849/m.23031 type:complete len:204 (-) Transcript_13849:44-655(-)|eukprot:CAMPEP_0197725334 /NCGR_PEP_ID=MMETSP1434-20131217/6908_1 /TAXON_ID=265543 /ORGANISM="Minutocellus polymorphus, Strain CCMP3303" /LENGTH=203 /DNA_ID=CAMNT_0043310791 /DNA_START=103 /DNA_END=714 /DNA_ORIENTATION=-
MSSFELKPQTAINPFSKNIDELLFTYPRNRVPPQLEARGVSRSTWMKTYDGVASIYEMSLEASKQMKLHVFIFLPCFLPCMMPKMMKVSSDVYSAWLELVKSQTEIYQKHGINVTLAKEYRSRTTGTGSDRRFRMDLETVGLRFEMSNDPVQTQFPQIPTVQARPVAKDDILTRLEKVNGLYKDGAISYEEYTQLKSRVMAGE